MRFAHPLRPGRVVRLAYCQNLHPARTTAELLELWRNVVLPLRERTAPGRRFGMGLYFSAALVGALCESAELRTEIARFLDQHALDPFTFNAFPFGDFDRDGLKARVFEPDWSSARRVEYTGQVARVAVELARGLQQVSISTHTGAHSSHPAARDEAGLARGLSAMLTELARLEAHSGVRVVLALEPEPRANAGDQGELAGLRRRWLASGALDPILAERHLGACLDTCHSAVEFEPPQVALACATAERAPLGKLQFTSALALEEPGRPRAAEALLALDEPRFLHQVTGRSASGLLRVGDLDELARALNDPHSPWTSCDQWRCHFHVPVDRTESQSLGTTRDEADQSLELALAAPDLWGASELHVEIETYTWTVLQARSRENDGGLVDSLEREYRHVLALLDRHGWRAS